MTGRKRRNHSSVFKAKVALAAEQGEHTLAELAEQFDVRPNQIQDWKKRLVQGAADLFGGNASKARHNDPLQAKLDAATQRIGELVMENEMLRRERGKVGRPLGRKRSWR